MLTHISVYLMMVFSSLNMEAADICIEVTFLEINKTFRFFGQRRTFTSTIWYKFLLEFRRNPCEKYHIELGETENSKWEYGLSVSSEMIRLFLVCRPWGD